jgi:MFS family permease
MALGTGMGIGRFFGGRIMHKLSLDHLLLTILGLQFVGFFGIWFSHNLVISMVMLLLSGLGISMQFALTSLRMINHSDGRPDLAIGKSSLAAGLAIGGAPFLLGVLGDSFGISRAYLMVPVLILIAVVIVIATVNQQVFPSVLYVPVALTVVIVPLPDVIVGVYAVHAVPVSPVPPCATVIVVPDCNIVPVAAGNVSVKSLFVFGAAMVSVPVPLALPETFTMLMVYLSMPLHRLAVE